MGFGTFTERSCNVVSERSPWTFVERPRERSGNVALHLIATLLERSQITFCERYKLVPKVLTAHLNTNY